MVSGDWFKNIISLKKSKDGRSKKLKGYKETINSQGNNLSLKEPPIIGNGVSDGNHTVLSMPIEQIAAIQIQKAFRAYMARKTLRHLKGIAKLQILTEGNSVKRQTPTTLSYLHSWTRIQAEIRARRAQMVAKGHLRQRKLDNQSKLEAKLQNLEVEWSGGPETMEEALARIHQREEAAEKRERTMAYAFSHQWRANSNPIYGSSNLELGKANWGWSWTERWIAARPWESRTPAKPSPKKSQNKQASKTSKITVPAKEKVPVKGNEKTKEASTKKQQAASEEEQT
ncbi:PREDICTED: protein IQ-DOMAIN 1-like isoform X2 [Ipomoea nil]|uniref:protein IQ-DOMAIN 1-like isoform X2 n=1 Tax=Ipomoea nil TaxID=35883 RepID=UPI0009014074|nr:PREDICTED: protein IQ-DOMAIN 1-like isoform X2 [Ipomoea nil]